jgi:ribosome biogenesis GTPase
MRAEILASHGRQYWVRELSSALDSAPLDDMPAVQPGKQRLAVTRGRRQDYCVGDQVEIETIGSDQAVINGLESRRNLLKRSDAFRQKLIAANIDQIGYVLAGEPPFSEPLAARVLVAASIASIPITWLVNKSDRVAALACIEPRLKLYRSLGVHTIYLSARDDEPETWLEGTLGSWLNEKTTLLMGQSGMGKSTLINRLVPDADLKTQQWSQALNSGKHTTSFSKCFDLPQPNFSPGSRIIDSPGFQQFGLTHCSRSEIENSLPEWADRAGQCRYHNCKHLQEPGCMIRAATDECMIDAYRYTIWQDLVSEQDRSA